MAAVNPAEYWEMMDGKMVDYLSNRMAILSIFVRINRSVVLVKLPKSMEGKWSMAENGLWSGSCLVRDELSAWCDYGLNGRILESADAIKS